MSASSPYQSRLFQRLTQQSHRWSQQWQKTLHRGQQAAVWGVQALLFPIYMLLHGAQQGAKRLRQTRSSAQLSAFGRHKQAGENSASLVETITPVSEVLAAVPEPSDWLRPRQFLRSLLGQLQQLRAWQPLGFLAQGDPEPVALTPATQDESTAAHLSCADPPQRPFLLPWQPQRFLVRVDRAVAMLERQSGKLLWGRESEPQSITPPPAVGQDAFRIQTLIYAAIAYFFGRRQHTLLSSASEALPSSGNLQTSASHSLQGSAPATLAPAPSGGLWITWQDLFGRAVQPVAAATAPSSASLPPQPRTQSRTLPKSGFPAIPPIPGVSLVGDGINLEIETEAVFMGYVKHPLRQILEWLDRVIAWVEKRLAAIWNNVCSFVAGFLGLPGRS